MLYRLRVDLCFNEEVSANGVFEKAKAILGKAVKIAVKGDGLPEVSFIEVHKCYHDEDPRKPCEIIKRVEV